MNTLPFVTLKVFTPLVKIYGNLQLILVPFVATLISVQVIPPRVTDALLRKLLPVIVIVDPYLPDWFELIVGVGAVYVKFS